MSRDRLQTQDLFLPGTEWKCADVGENVQHVTYSIQSGSRNDLIYRRPSTFISGRSESSILFLDFFFSLHVVIAGYLKMYECIFYS